MNFVLFLFAVKSHCPNTRDLSTNKNKNSKVNDAKILGKSNSIGSSNGTNSVEIDFPAARVKAEMINKSGKDGEKQTNTMSFTRTENKSSNNHTTIMDEIDVIISGGREHDRSGSTNRIEEDGSTSLSQEICKMLQMHSSTPDAQLNNNYNGYELNNGKTTKCAINNITATSGSSHMLLPCGYCQKEFSSKDKLLKHLDQHGNDDIRDGGMLNPSLRHDNNNRGSSNSESNMVPVQPNGSTWHTC